MRRYKRNTILLTGILLILTIAFRGGYTQTDSASAIMAIPRVYKDSVKIRWAPTDPVSWEYLNKYGYKVKRKTILRNDKLLTVPEVKWIGKDTLKPAPLEKWEPWSEKDDYVSIAAQAIFGETFEISSSFEEADMMTVVQKVREMENRYSFALFAADMSPLTARLSGLMITDRKIKANEKYLYIIIPCVPVEVHRIDTGYVYIGPEDYEPLPKPKDLKAEFGDKKVLLSWNHQYLDRYYTA